MTKEPVAGGELRRLLKAVVLDTADQLSLSLADGTLSLRSPWSESFTTRKARALLRDELEKLL